MKNKMVKFLVPVGIVVAGIVISGVFSSMKKPPEKKEEKRLSILVDAKPIVFEDLTYRIKTQGTVKAKLETNLSSEVNGRIVAVSDAFVEGGFFNEGDVLVKVEAFDYLTNVKSAEASLASAQSALEEEKAKGRVAEKEWRSFTSGEAPELGLRRPQLASALANVRSAEAELERAKRDLSRTEIRAPYAGMVKARNVNLGQFISKGASVGVIYGTDVAEIRLPLTDNDLAFLQIPDHTNHYAEPDVVLSAVVAGSIHQWQAKLVRTEGVLDERSRVIYAVAQVNDPYQRHSKDKQALRFGRFVQAEVLGVSASQVLVIARHLLLIGDQVLVVDKDNILQLRNVEVERSDERFAYVRNGFLEGDRLITSAISNPLVGTSVRVASDIASEKAGENETQQDDGTQDAARLETSKE